MSSSQQIASFRKVSAGILASAHLAGLDDRPVVAKRDISLVLKRVSPALGIDGTTYHVLDILLGLVQSDDFQAGRRPVVAISNQRLADYTQRSTRTVARCLKKLVEAGILAYRDSSTGRRFVYRGHAGEPEQAFGLDFTPTCFNLEAFKEQADAFQRRLRQQQAAKRAVIRHSRAIVDLVNAMGPEFADFETRCEEIRLREGVELIDRAELLKALYLEALEAVHEMHKDQNSNEKTTCEGDISVIPLPITSHPDSLTCKKERTCSNEQENKSKSDNGYAVEMAFEKKPSGGGNPSQQANKPADTSRSEKSTVSATTPGINAGKTNLDGVSIGLLQSACSTVQAEIGASFSSWPAICDAAEDLRVLIGLSPAGYLSAVERQGRYLAAACLAVVAEKALRDPEQISSPGGYFRAMIDRAGEGKLHLYKTLHGLVNT
ncbi:plasmid replication protein RepC [Roseibium suaedae]|uniref:Replication initiation protein RepC n=1 Tax=Roseibium suaedae TaxID=735517 RepID=A0A1M7NQB3_9HYPH|nr:plasmid replication protein RepC [Roseibium suaedae]SHN06299.1 replication initiation protein RepC [Roseibium suaedae]